MITLGRNLGTTALKRARVGEDDEIIASACRALTVQRTAPARRAIRPLAAHGQARPRFF